VDAARSLIVAAAAQQAPSLANDLRESLDRGMVVRPIGTDHWYSPTKSVVRPPDGKERLRPHDALQN